MRLSVLAGVAFLLVTVGFSSANAVEQPASTGNTTITHAIEEQMKEYESAWNREDLSAVESQYDSSMFGILHSDLLDYTAYLAKVEAFMAQHARMKIEVVNVRPLGHDYAAVNGTVYATFSDGHQAQGLFTVIYQRRQGKWKLIYSHS